VSVAAAYRGGDIENQVLENRQNHPERRCGPRSSFELVFAGFRRPAKTRPGFCRFSEVLFTCVHVATSVKTGENQLT
jgi:hypothetical protein